LIPFCLSFPEVPFALEFAEFLASILFILHSARPWHRRRGNKLCPTTNKEARSMSYGKAWLACGLVLSLCSCAGLTTYEPIIDTQGVDLTAYEQDLLECREFGEQVSVGKRTAGGAATGAVAGAATGAVFGNGGLAGRMGGFGGVTGGVGGAGRGYGERAEVIRNCLLGRGYRVLN
jgi:hypothetical protein